VQFLVRDDPLQQGADGRVVDPADDASVSRDGGTFALNIEQDALLEASAVGDVAAAPVGRMLASGFVAGNRSAGIAYPAESARPI